MILGFSTHWPEKMGDLAGNPTHFPEKIWTGLPLEYHDAFYKGDYEAKYYARGFPIFGCPHEKIHTIREDKHDIWKIGMKIHPAIGVRTKDYFQFAPVLECKSIQKIEIQYLNPKYPTLKRVKIDGIPVFSVLQDARAKVFVGGHDFMQEIALNDGFDSIDHFFRWFDKDFVGKIIHWTDKKY